MTENPHLRETFEHFRKKIPLNREFVTLEIRESPVKRQ